MFSYLAERWQAFIVFGIVAILWRLYYMRTGKYRKKKADRGKGVFHRAAFSMATGIFTCYPAAYFILADIFRDYPEEAWRLDLGISEVSKIFSGSFQWTTSRIIGWSVLGALVLMALISLILGLASFLPHLDNIDLLLAYAVPPLFWIGFMYTRLLFNIGNAGFDPNADYIDGSSLYFLIPKTCKLVVPILFVVVFILFCRQIKQRRMAKMEMSSWEYADIALAIKREKEYKEAREQEIRNRPAPDYSRIGRPTITRDDDDDDDWGTSPRDNGKATIKDMPSVIQDSSGKTYRRTSYGGTPATYTCDEDYHTITIYNVYQSESYWMNTNAGHFDIVSW